MKRFVETNCWREVWFAASLQAKVAWKYLVDNCDAAGVWGPDFGLADFSIGEALDWPGIKIQLGGRIEVMPNGKWWIPKFVAFQCGTLRPSARRIGR